MNITVIREFRRPHPLAWIHRAEARSVAAELRVAGHKVSLVPFRHDGVIPSSSDAILLRLSDPVMRDAVKALTYAAVPFLGPGAAVLERCYDKFEAHRVASAVSIDCPDTTLGSDAGAAAFPVMLKPRRGSDSIGVRLWMQGDLPKRVRSERFIVRRYVRGAELTVAVLRDRVGMPLHIVLPEGTPYSFWRKYLWCPVRTPVGDNSLAERVRQVALGIAMIFGVDWAARIDLIHETATDRLRFLECDAAPLVGTRSAFAASFQAAGIDRAEQLQMLVNEIPE